MATYVSSIPAAITWLVAQVAALSECAAPVVVSDGIPVERADQCVVIGIAPDDDETGLEPIHAELGTQTQWEIYTIPCVLWARVGGTDMAAARTAAFTLLDAIDSLVRTTTGRTLGGALRSGSAILTPVRISQTDTASEAGDGRVCEIRFGVRCKSRSSAA
jgi:hypothetical protein